MKTPTEWLKNSKYERRLMQVGPKEIKKIQDDARQELLEEIELLEQEIRELKNPPLDPRRIIN